MEFKKIVQFKPQVTDVNVKTRSKNHALRGSPPLIPTNQRLRQQKSNTELSNGLRPALQLMVKQANVLNPPIVNADIQLYL